MTDEQYMQRCLQLAQLGLGNVAPNPLVGAVLVHGDKITGEGYHAAFGQAHAEVNAINSVQDPSLLKESTLYVNLEPCAHHGKTPPCCELIIKHGIRKVVVGMVDPFAAVNGKGIQQLRDAGIDVVTGVLEDNCNDLNKRFVTFHQLKRPYIILKWAQSADGFIGKLNERIIISNEHARLLSHKWRSEEQAIWAGSTTVATDNPQLNVREWKGNNPVRITIDKELTLPQTLLFFDGSQPTLIYNCKTESEQHNLTYRKIKNDEHIVEQILTDLHALQIQSVLVEGGSYTLQKFLDADLWDEARVFISADNLQSGVPAPLIKATLLSEHQTGNNRLLIYKRC